MKSKDAHDKRVYAELWESVVANLREMGGYRVSIAQLLEECPDIVDEPAILHPTAQAVLDAAQAINRGNDWLDFLCHAVNRWVAAGRPTVVRKKVQPVSEDGIDPEAQACVDGLLERSRTQGQRRKFPSPEDIKALSALRELESYGVPFGKRRGLWWVQVNPKNGTYVEGETTEDILAAIKGDKASTDLEKPDRHPFQPGDPAYGWQDQCSVVMDANTDHGHHCGYPPEAHELVGVSHADAETLAALNECRELGLAHCCAHGKWQVWRPGDPVGAKYDTATEALAAYKKVNAIAQSLSKEQARVLLLTEVVYHTDGPFRSQVDLPHSLGSWRTSSERHFFCSTPLGRKVATVLSTWNGPSCPPPPKGND